MALPTPLAALSNHLRDMLDGKVGGALGGLRDRDIQLGTRLEQLATHLLATGDVHNAVQIIGGAYSENNVLADLESVYASLEKLDLKWGDLGSTNNLEGAALVGLEDAAGFWNDNDLESVLIALATLIGGATDSARSYTDQVFVTDNEPLVDSIDALDQALGKAAKTIHAMAVFGTWQQDGDGAETNGGGLCGADVLLTEATNVYAHVYDAANAEFNQFDSSSGGTDYTGDYQLITDTKNDGDYAAFGHSVPFPEFAMEMVGGTAQTYTGDAGKWQYSQGGDTWADLTVFDNTDATAQDGKRPFGRDGAITFVPPSDWASDTVNGQDGYWIRWIVTTVANLNVVGLTNSKEHQFVTPADGWIAPCDGSIPALRACDGTTGTLHSNQDVTFIVMDYTNGRHSGLLTWAQDKRTDAWSGLTELSISDGDVLGVVCIQDDGTGGGPDEVINAVLELEVNAARPAK